MREWQQAMWSVRMSIPSDKFFDVMQEVSDWLSTEKADTSDFSYARDAAGVVRFRIIFSTEGEAERFAQQFEGSTVSASCPHS